MNEWISTLPLDAYHKIRLTGPVDGREILLLRIQNGVFTRWNYYFKRGLETYLQAVPKGFIWERAPK